MITALHQVFGRKYEGIAYQGSLGITRTRIFQSTKNGSILIDWGDGSVNETYNPTYKNTDFTITQPDLSSGIPSKTHDYSTDVLRNIKLTYLNGINDLYSIYLNGGGLSYTNAEYIANFGDYIKQFTSIYSLYIDFPGSGYQTIIGDMSEIPNSLERILIKRIRLANNSDLYLNLSNFSNASQLKYFKSESSSIKNFVNVYGDLSKLPPLINYFLLAQNLANTLTYTAGRTWASSFDTLDIGNATMSYSDIDNLLNDMNNSITTAIGGKVIHINGYYTNTTAYNGLIAKGFTITGLTIRQKILDLPLQNNFTDTTGINTMIAGGTSNLPTFTLEGGEYAATFNGSQSIKTSANLTINSDKVTIAFWIKTTQTTRATLGNGSSIDLSLNAWAGTLGIYTNGNTGGNAVTTQRNFVNWTHIVIIYDRSLGKDQGKIYVNGVLNFSQRTDNYANNIGNFVASIFILGQSVSLTQGFNGQLKFLKIFNYPLSTTEITNLYNKTM